MKYKKSFRFVNIIMLLIIIISGCSKFEDGPIISLTPVDNRICREWKIEYTIDNETGIKHSADYKGWTFIPEKGGQYTQTIYYNQIQIKSNGFWEINGNQLRIEYPGTLGNIIEYYTILRLTKKECWVKDALQEIHYFSE